MAGTMRRGLGASAMACLTTMSVLIMTCFVFAEATSTSAGTEPAPCCASAAKEEQEKESKAPAAAGDAGRPPNASPGSIVPLTVGTQRQQAKPAQDHAAKGLQSPARAGQPRWACDAKTVTVEPVWSGKIIQATWVIRNQGQADLTIKLRGG